MENFLDFDLRDGGVHAAAGFEGSVCVGHVLTPQEARDTLARLRGVIAQLPEGEAQ